MRDALPCVAIVATGLIAACIFFAHNHVYTLAIGKPSPALYMLRHDVSGHAMSFSAIDGLFYASNYTPPARFRIVEVSKAMVTSLYDQALRTDSAALRLGIGGVKTKTRSGCACSGFSNEHGFGRFCHAWETPEQDPWCYVSDACGKAANASSTLALLAAGKRGSFGRQFEPCTDAPPPPAPPSPPPPPMPPLPPSPPRLAPPPSPMHIAPPGGVWVAPEGCTCSGYANKHGFGSACAAWESHLPGGENQVPWCYVHENCQAASVRRKKGTFGKTFAECVVRMPSAAAAPKKGVLASLFGRRLSADPAAAVPPTQTQAGQAFAKHILGAKLRPTRDAAADLPQTGAGQAFAKHVLGAKLPQGKRAAQKPAPRASAAAAMAFRGRGYGLELDTSATHLMDRMARHSPRYVALLHEESQTCAPPAPPAHARVPHRLSHCRMEVSLGARADLSVQRPPHKLALKPHALSAELSVHAIFALVKPPRRASTPSVYSPATPLSYTPRSMKSKHERRAAAHARSLARARETFVVSVGVAAYLTLCPDHPPGDVPADVGAAAAAAALGGAGLLASKYEGATLCAGYRQEKRWAEPLKLLRRPSVPAAPALFALVPA